MRGFNLAQGRLDGLSFEIKSVMGNKFKYLKAKS